MSEGVVANRIASGGSVAAPLREGDRLAGRYVLGRRLRRGTASDVFAAHDDLLQRRVAVEVFVAGTPAERFRWLHQLRLLAELDHPTLLTVHDLGQDDDGRHYVITRLVEGLTLAERIRRGPQRPDRVLALGSTMAEALARMHAAGLVHRNISPAVIRLDATARPVLDDLAGASASDLDALTIDEVSLRGEADAAGERYLAPEQVVGGTVGAPADVYALGVVLVDCLTPQSPFPTRSGPTAARGTLDLGKDLTSVAPAVVDLLTAMTRPEPDARPTAAEAGAALDAAAHRARCSGCAPSASSGPAEEEVAEPGAVSAVARAGAGPAGGGQPRAAAPAPEVRVRPAAADGRRPGPQVGRRVGQRAGLRRRAATAALVVAAFGVGLAAGHGVPSGPGSIDAPTSSVRLLPVE